VAQATVDSEGADSKGAGPLRVPRTTSRGNAAMTLAAVDSKGADSKGADSKGAELQGCRTPNVQTPKVQNSKGAELQGCRTPKVQTPKVQNSKGADSIGAMVLTAVDSKRSWEYATVKFSYEEAGVGGRPLKVPLAASQRRAAVALVELAAFRAAVSRAIAQAPPLAAFRAAAAGLDEG
jgi:hypothetical protein